jgi:hypothetical protein
LEGSFYARELFFLFLAHRKISRVKTSFIIRYCHAPSMRDIELPDYGSASHTVFLNDDEASIA